MRRYSVTMLIGWIALLGIFWAGRALADETVQGRVIKATLTACSVKEGKPGRCEGTMVLETTKEGETAKMEIAVTRDITLTLDKKKVFLPSLKGAFATVTYVARDGKNVATSVVAQTP